MSTNAPPVPAEAVFDRIVVGIDGTPESYEAARQAGDLQPLSGALHLCAVVESAKSVHAGIRAAAIADEMRRTSLEALERAAAATRPTTETLLEGEPVANLLEQARRRRATLLVLGSHNHRRTPGLLFGSAGSRLLREAPCSILTCRRSWATGRPERIVAGVDGSPAAARASDVARTLAEHFDARLELVVGLGGKLRTADNLLQAEPTTVVDARSPVEALVAGSNGVDLVVVGSRGLHGLHALGSVSERVVHQAQCSVLVVR